MEKIVIIRDKSALDGTCYVEVVPGKYQKKHWQEGSLFFEEEVFGLIEPIFERNINRYDHYDMNDASKFEWLNIIIELEQLNELLISSDDFNGAIGKVSYIFRDTREWFQKNYEENKHYLISMNKELITWAKTVLKTHDNIAILGL